MMMEKQVIDRNDIVLYHENLLKIFYHVKFQMENDLEEKIVQVKILSNLLNQ